MEQDALDKKRELVIALRRQKSMALREAFDPQKPGSRPVGRQMDVLREMKDYLFLYLQGGNQSGKTQTGARAVSWLFQGHHPYWNFQEQWGDEPLLILIVGRLNNQVEEIWDRRIKPYLEPGSYRENRQGGTLQYVVNLHNKNKFVFATHNNPMEAREKLQSYTAHMVWLDELTDHLPIIEELQRRVQAKRGRLLLTYTPKIRAEAVKTFLETPTPYSKMYRISMLDNPVYDGRREELMSQIGQLPQAQQDTILYGDWFVGDQAVFSFDPNQHIEPAPGYSPLWPHIAVVDPAASGLMGFSLWTAPNPNAARWWCIKSEYMRGAAPSDLVEQVEAKIAFAHILFRLSDTHETWFFKEAAKQKITYRGVPNKHGRKKELITGLNQGFASGRIRLAPEASELAAELSSAQWSETVEDRIVNASRYHLADTAQYLVDQLPKVKDLTPLEWTFDQQLKHANQQRLKHEALRRGESKKQTWRIVARRGKQWTRSA